jgi:hypothetical protein
VDRRRQRRLRAGAGRPGYEGTEKKFGIAPLSGLKTSLGPFVAAAAGVAWLATLTAHLFARQGRILRARQAVAGAFAAFVIAAILVATVLLRGPGEPIPTRVGIALVPRWDVGVWVSLVGAALGAVACGVVVTKMRLPLPRAPRGRA